MKRVIGGVVLIFGGLFMLAGFFTSTRPSAFLVNIILLLLFVLAPIVSGSILLRSHFLVKKKREQESRKNVLAVREKEILKLAKEKGGELTIPEIVAETSMNTEEADEMMREFVVKGYVDMRLTDLGAVIYEFFELRTDRTESAGLVKGLWSEDREIQ
jgi:hypothetical protein